MKYEIRVPKSKAFPLYAVAAAIARAEATRGGTEFHRPTYKGALDSLVPALVREAKDGRLVVTDQYGFSSTVENLVSPDERATTAYVRFDDKVREVSHDMTVALNCCTTLHLLNEWAATRGDEFVLTDEWIGWIDERGEILPPIPIMQDRENPSTDTLIRVSEIPDLFQHLEVTEKWQLVSRIMCGLGSDNLPLRTERGWLEDLDGMREHAKLAAKLATDFNKYLGQEDQLNSLLKARDFNTNEQIPAPSDWMIIGMQFVNLRDQKARSEIELKIREAQELNTKLQDSYVLRSELEAWLAQQNITVTKESRQTFEELNYHSWFDHNVAAMPGSAPEDDDAPSPACAPFREMEDLAPGEVTIEFVAGDAGRPLLSISARGQTRRVGLVEIGLEDRRKGVINYLGIVLLKMAQEKEMRVSKPAEVTLISRLGKRLKLHLGLEASPFIAHRGQGRYEPKFSAFDRLSAADERAKQAAKARTVSLDREDVQALVDKRQVASAESDYPYEEDDLEEDAASEWLRERLKNG